MKLEHYVRVQILNVSCNKKANIPLSLLIYEEHQILSLFILISGAQLGTVFALPISGWLCDQKSFAGGWPSVFYVFGKTVFMFSQLNFVCA